MDMQTSLTLEQEIRELAESLGADVVGFTNRDRLKDAPPSADIRTVLDNAESAIGFAIGHSKEAVEAYVLKQDYMMLNREHAEVYRKLGQIGKAVGKLLESRGYDVHVPMPNFEYREEDNGPEKMTPVLSHKYICEAAGVGWHGWSGNLLTHEFGAAVLISSVVTSARLEPSPVIDEDWCSKCHICVSTCSTNYMPKQDADEVVIAGRTVRYAKRRSAWRCMVTCSGCNGKKKDDSKWSTWSTKYVEGLPDRFAPDEEFDEVCNRLSDENQDDFLWAGMKTAHENKTGWSILDDFPKTSISCSLCQYVCVPGMENRRRLYRGLVAAGTIEEGDPRLDHGEQSAAEGFKTHQK